jgi:hypothetical protein
MAVNPARYMIVFIVMLLSVGINVEQQMLMLYFNRSYLVLTLLAIAITGLLAHRNLFFIVLVSGLSFTINLPQGMLQLYSINPDILFLSLVALIITPTFIKLLGLTSNSREIAGQY